MTEKKIDFWQDHSVNYLEMAFRHDHDEVLSHPDGYGKKTGDCGDTIEFFLLVTDQVITRVSFRINGCRNTYACANTIVHLVEGHPVNSAWDITPERVCAYLKTLPADHFHCAELAVGALYLALANIQDTQRAPWKKLYR